MILVITGKHKLRNNKIEKGCLKGRTSCHAETSSERRLFYFLDSLLFIKLCRSIFYPKRYEITYPEDLSIISGFYYCIELN